MRSLETKPSRDQDWLNKVTFMPSPLGKVQVTALTAPDGGVMAWQDLPPAAAATWAAVTALAALTLGGTVVVCLVTGVDPEPPHAVSPATAITATTASFRFIAPPTWTENASSATALK